MRSTLSVLLLIAPLTALAADDRITLPVDDPPPAAPAVEPLPAAEPSELTAVDAPPEGIWAWVARMEGEVLTEDAVRALHERAEVQRAEDAVNEPLGDPDVPLDLYDDPLSGVSDDPLGLSAFNAERYDIPVQVNADVRRWMRYFLGNGRKHFQRYLSRMSIYTPLMLERLQAAGLPRDLIYLAMVESGFNAHAYSHAGAAGLWQFMPATGRMYDLRVDWWVDDRRDPIKSTDAAVALLIDLHKMFKGDWYLAWSAYNAGPGRVRRAMRAGGSSDFWVLARGGHLPTETANYTPKILAAAILARDAERYGFDPPSAAPLQVETVWVDGAVVLSALARSADLTIDELKHLNPGLRRGATPAEGYALNVPAGRVDRFRTALAALPDTERTRYVRHTVLRGETLSRIAAKHGVTTDDLVRANNLVNRDRIVVGMSLIVPGGGAVSPSTSPASTPAAATYTVQRGDALSAIARSTGVSTANLRTWNGLTGDVIHPGQVLRLRAPSPAADGDRVVSYTVRAGDSLGGIAARYGVSVADLQEWNHIANPSRIAVGDVIQVHRQRWASYRVRRGDSLARIAQEQRCSVDDLRSWNRIDGAVIHPGQELRILR